MRGRKTGDRKAGTPNKSNAVYSEDLAEILCERYASSTDTLGEVCSAEDMPSLRTVFSWRKSHPDFAEKFYDAETRHTRACFE
jgi:hypothetical protein